jgi:hypothetical protein
MTAIVAGQSVTAAPPSSTAAHPTSAVLYFATVPQEDTLIYGSLQHDEYRLLRPIRLVLSTLDAVAVVSWNEAGITASGPTLDDALTSFRSTVISQIASSGADDVLSEYVERRAS